MSGSKQSDSGDLNNNGGEDPHPTPERGYAHITFPHINTTHTAYNKNIALHKKNMLRGLRDHGLPSLVTLKKV